MTKKKPVKKKTQKKSSLSPSSSTKIDAIESKINKPPNVVPMPTAGRKITEFEDRLDAQLAGDTTTAGAKRGRPRKDEQPPAPEIDISVIGQAIEIPFDLWSVSQGVDGLKITHAEAVMIAKPLKQLLDHYIPQVPEIAWAWISLTAVSFTIFKARLALIAEIKKQKTSSEHQTDAARGVNSSKVPQGHGGSHPSGVFPTAAEIKKPVV